MIDYGLEVYVIVREYFKNTAEHFFEATSYDFTAVARGRGIDAAKGHGRTERAAQDDLYRQVAAVLPEVTFVRTGEAAPIHYAPEPGEARRPVRTPLSADEAAFESILREMEQTPNPGRFSALVGRIIDECSDSQKDRVYKLFGGTRPETS